MFLEKLRNNYRNKKSLAFTLAFVVMVSMLTMGAVTDIEAKTVTLVQKDSFNNTEYRREVVTRKATLDEFLKEQGITLAEEDVVDAELSAELQSKQVITIEKSKVIEIHIDGQIRFERTVGNTVSKALELSDLGIVDSDIVTPERNTEITDGLVINVTRFGTVEETVVTEIPYEAIVEYDNNRYLGDDVLKQGGMKGQKTEVFKVTRQDGIETQRELVSSVVDYEPIAEIVIKGTKQKEAVVSKKQTMAAANKDFTVASKERTHPAGFSYKSSFNVNATAYSSHPSENGGYSKTAYGLIPQYGVVAVDPKVIPLGTKLYIESSDGGASWVYGYCIAGDTGGAIKGYKVDLCFNTIAECKKFGRKTATVYILN